MSDQKLMSIEQIIHLIDQTHERIWEDDTIEQDIDFRMMRFIIARLKTAFLKEIEVRPLNNLNNL